MTEQRTWPELLSAVLRREDLSVGDAAWAMDRVMSGEATSAQVAGLAVALRAKGETVDEIEGLVDSMYAPRGPSRSRAPPSTSSAPAATARTRSTSPRWPRSSRPAPGATVVKHGNRAASSSCRRADVLEELGVALDLRRSRRPGRGEAGITFCFAPVFHPALRHAAVAAQANSASPPSSTSRPADQPGPPPAAAVGVFDDAMAPIMAGVFARRGVEALVFRGDDGLDEISVATTTTVWTASGGEVRRESFDPREVGIEYSPLSAPARRGPGVQRGGGAQAAGRRARRGAGRGAVVVGRRAGGADADARAGGGAVGSRAGEGRGVDRLGGGGAGAGDVGRGFGTVGAGALRGPGLGLGRTGLDWTGPSTRADR